MNPRVSSRKPYIWILTMTSGTSTDLPHPKLVTRTSSDKTVNQFCLRMGTELVPETLYSNELSRLCAWEDYIESCRRESFKTYTKCLSSPHFVSPIPRSLCLPTSQLITGRTHLQALQSTHTFKRCKSLTQLCIYKHVMQDHYVNVTLMVVVEQFSETLMFDPSLTWMFV
jgi:hypothetical protein